MGALSKIAVVGIILMLTSVSTQVHAQWIEHGTAMCLNSNSQDVVLTCSDSEGGAIMVWRDFRNGNFDVFAQRIDSRGTVLWTPDGVPICTNGQNQSDIVITSDGAGGVIAAWTDYRSTTNFDVYTQRLDPDGNPLWTIGGVPVCTESSHQIDPRIVTDGSEGAIVCWYDRRGATDEIYIQRINSGGSVMWTSNGVLVSTYVTTKFAHEMVEDLYGGAYVVWYDDRNGNSDIFGQRITSSGIRSWTDEGYGICTEAESQFNPSVTGDGFGGLILAWTDYRSTTSYDIYAQRITNAVGEVWTPGGLAICTASGWQQLPKLVTDGNVGAIIAWEDIRAGYIEIYAQRVDYQGTSHWTANGVDITEADVNCREFEMISDGEGGAIFCWEDFRYQGPLDIYAQRINSSGAALWTSGGEVVSAAVTDQMDPCLTSDGRYGAIFAWPDVRNANYDIFAQRIERNGYWGYPAPAITGLRDIPGDQGGWLHLAFDASRLDVYPENSISHYTIWRAIDETAAMAMLENGTIEYEKSLEIHDLAALEAVDGTQNRTGVLTQDEAPSRSPVIRLGQLAGEPYYWEQIAELPSSDYIDHYSINVETMFDSTGSSDENHYFQVIAHESDPTAFWESLVDSAYSIDNLAPAVPLGLAGEQVYSPGGMLLSWDPNGESDLAGYKIYRGTSSGFLPGPTNFVASTPDTMTLDGDWSWDAGYWYKVAAVDIHGNESLFAVLGPDMVTGDDPMPVPDATFLDQNYPNPFNPITTITFGLKSSDHVSLRIYDAAGRLVTVLINESRPAGQYAAVWNGKDRNGSSVASGVYFYRLITKEFEETRKMILLR